MTTYTIDQIEAAIRKGIKLADGKSFSISPDFVIAELQRPAWVPAEGEVAYCPSTNTYLAYRPEHAGIEFQPQSLANHGPAVKALRDAMLYQYEYGGRSTAAVAALTALDEVVK